MTIFRQAAVALGLAAIALAGCSLKPGEDDAARDVFERVRAEQFDEVRSDFIEEMRTPETRAGLEQLREKFIPDEAPQSSRLLNWATFDVGTIHTLSTRHEYRYPDRLLLVTTNLVRTSEDAPYFIQSFGVNSFTPEDIEATRFKLLGKPAGHYAFVAALLASVALMTWAVVWTIRAKRMKRKWLWAILALFGGPVFQLNWTTGVWGVFATIGLINAGVFGGASAVDPWIMKWQPPIGALIVLWRLQRGRRKPWLYEPRPQTEENAPPSSSAGTPS